MAVAVDEDHRSKMRRIMLASFVGTSLEWYDFFIYGAVAALVFNKVFFPSFDPMVGTLLAFATFAVGFVARPLGALFFGHYGDTIGRKNVLVATMVIMGVTTFGIGLLPTYEQIGVSATILLVAARFIQGFALGGEWGGAVLMTAEHGDANRRTFQTSWAQTGIPVGNVLSVGVLALTSKFTTDAEFIAWGWRIPFLLSAALVAVGLWIRFGLEESPEFVNLAAEKKTARRPLVDLFKNYRREIVIACFVRVGADVSFYVFTLYMLTYITMNLGLERYVALQAVLIASVIQIFATPVLAQLADRYGLNRIFLIGSVGAAIWAFPFFPIIGTKEPMLITLAICVAMTFWAFMSATLAAFISGLFPVAIRYSGTSFGYQIAGIFGGGLAPLIATSLFQKYQSPLAVSAYVSGTLLLATVALLVARRGSART